MINDYINIKKTLLSLISIQNILILRLLNLKWPMFIIYMLYKYIKSSSKPFLQYHPSKQIFVNKMLSLHKHHRILFSRFGTLQSFLQLHRRVQKIKCHSVCLKVPFNGEIVIDVIDNVNGRGCCDKKSGRGCCDKKSERECIDKSDYCKCGRECIDRNNDSGLNDGNNDSGLSDKKSGRECIDRNNNNKLNDRIYNDSGLNVVIDNLCRVDENIVCNRENCNKSSTENLYLLEDSTILNENINQVEDTTKLITESTVDNSTIKDSAIDNSSTYSIVENSITNSTIKDSAVDNFIINSAVDNSITNSTLNNTNTNITNSTLNNTIINKIDHKCTNYQSNHTSLQNNDTKSSKSLHSLSSKQSNNSTKSNNTHSKSTSAESTPINSPSSTQYNNTHSTKSNNSSQTNSPSFQYNNTHSTKNVLLVHGFNGSSNSKYIIGLSHHFTKLNYRVFCFNARGTKNRLKNEIFFHIGWTVDIKVTCEYILSNYDGTLELYGFSMGASWVTKYLGESIINPRIIKGGGICLPFDFYKIESEMKKTYKLRLINRILTLNYFRYIRRNKDIFENAGVNCNNILKCKNLRDIDKLLTKKIFKFKNISNYYKSQSCKKYIKNLSIPFLILNSKDDPIIPENVIDKKVCKKNTNVLLVVNPWGGHLGFLKDSLSQSLADEIIVEFSLYFE